LHGIDVHRIAFAFCAAQTRDRERRDSAPPHDVAEQTMYAWFEYFLSDNLGDYVWKFERIASVSEYGALSKDQVLERLRLLYEQAAEREGYP
jgi:hypothetical protein